MTVRRSSMVFIADVSPEQGQPNLRAIDRCLSDRRLKFVEVGVHNRRHSIESLQLRGIVSHEIVQAAEFLRRIDLTGFERGEIGGIVSGKAAMLARFSVEQSDPQRREIYDRRYECAESIRLF
jgi:hypothetical protein